MQGGHSYKDLVDSLIQVIADCFSKQQLFCDSVTNLGKLTYNF